MQGSLEDGIPTSTAELYSWGSNKWNTSLNNMTYARYRHQTTAYNQTYMLVLGGQGPSGAVLSSVEYLSLKYGEFSLAVRPFYPYKTILRASLDVTIALASSLIHYKDRGNLDGIEFPFHSAFAERLDPQNAIIAV